MLWNGLLIIYYRKAKPSFSSMSSLVLPPSQQTLLLTQTLLVRKPFCFFFCLLSFLGTWWVICVLFFRDKPSKWWFFSGDCRTRRLLQAVVPSLSLPLFTQRSESKTLLHNVLKIGLGIDSSKRPSTWKIRPKQNDFSITIFFFEYFYIKRLMAA